MRSNLKVWVRLQEAGYFENHPCYNGIADYGGHEAVQAINWFMPLSQDMTVAVIGCGYGRETLRIAPLVNRVYGIDVSRTILDKAVSYLTERNVGNFTPVSADAFVAAIPQELDLVFSMIVMQHLTRDLVRNYFLELTKKLKRRGGFVVQFLEEVAGDRNDDAPEDSGGEPSISWSVWQLVELARASGLTFVEVRTQLATESALWHWAHFRKDGVEHS
jgi:SAM-dependent methyltransferase